MFRSSNSKDVVEQTVIYHFVCPCGTHNRGTLVVTATTTQGACNLAKNTPLACSSCKAEALRAGLKMGVQLLSF